MLWFGGASTHSRYKAEMVLDGILGQERILLSRSSIQRHIDQGDIFVCNFYSDHFLIRRHIIKCSALKVEMNKRVEKRTIAFKHDYVTHAIT